MSMVKIKKLWLKAGSIPLPLPLALVLLCCVMVFGQVSGFSALLYDDQTFVYDNPHVSSGLSIENAQWAFRSTRESNLWTPLTWLSHQLDVTLFGLDSGWHHLMTLGLHLSSIVLLWFLLGSLRFDQRVRFFVVAAFALHPHAAEVVGWVACRKEALASFCILAALLAWSEALKSARRWYYGASVIFSIMALLSKPSAVVLPLLMCCVWVYGRLSKQHQVGWKIMLARLVPIALLAAAMAVVTIRLQRSGGLNEVSSLMPLEMRLKWIPSVLFHYGQTSLALKEYQLFVVPSDASPSVWPLLICMLGGGGLLFFLVVKKQWEILLGLSWFTAFLLPVLGVVPVSVYFVADRYVYLAQIGLFLAFAVCVTKMINVSFANRGSMSMTVCRTFFYGLVMLGLGWLASLSAVQVGYWRDGVSLFTRQVQLSPQDFTAQYQCARALREAGQTQRAMNHFEQSVRLDSRSPAALSSYGQMLMDSGLVEEACEVYMQLITANRSADPEVFLVAGAALSKNKYPQQALAVFQRGLDGHPDDIRLMNACGLTLGFLLRRPDDGLVYFRRVREVASDDPTACQLGAKLLRQMGCYEEARSWLEP